MNDYTDDELWEDLHATRNWRYEQHERDAINDVYEQREWRSVWAYRVLAVVLLVALVWVVFNSDLHGTTAPTKYPTHEPTTEEPK